MQSQGEIEILKLLALDESPTSTHGCRLDESLFEDELQRAYVPSADLAMLSDPQLQKLTNWNFATHSSPLHAQIEEFVKATAAAAKGRIAEERPRLRLEESTLRAMVSEELSKRGLTASGRRRAALETFIRKSLAAGETLEDLVAYARRHDLETANQLQEIGNALVR